MTARRTITLLEVTPEKSIVWIYRDASKPGVRHFQILGTHGAPLAGSPLR